MQRTFEVFKHPLGDSKAVKRGFSWPGFFFTWIWAFLNRLWLAGIAFVVLSSILSLLSWQLSPTGALLNLSAGLILAIVFGLKGNSWKSEKMQRCGYQYLGAIKAKTAAEALAKIVQFGGAIPDELKVRVARARFFSMPSIGQGLLAITWLTWKAAFRFRLFLVIAVLLLGAVVGLPLLIKDDGTARGFTQILLTYTLSTITACGALVKSARWRWPGSAATKSSLKIGQSSGIAPTMIPTPAPRNFANTWLTF